MGGIGGVGEEAGDGAGAVVGWRLIAPSTPGFGYKKVPLSDVPQTLPRDDLHRDSARLWQALFN